MAGENGTQYCLRIEDSIGSSREVLASLTPVHQTLDDRYEGYALGMTSQNIIKGNAWKKR